MITLLTKIAGQLRGLTKASESGTRAHAHAPTHPRNLLYEVDEIFNGLYDAGLNLTGTPDVVKPAYSKRRERFYNLAQFFLQVQKLEGAIAECGCWKGLSSYMLCHLLRRHRAGFRGAGYQIFDSFEGLSVPVDADMVMNPKLQSADATRPAGSYAAAYYEVRASLAEFPEIEYHKGWLPQSLEGLPEQRYRFVHVDVDLYEPSKGCLEYFYPRLVPNGMIVSDDYGSLYWPGAKKAIDDFCAEHQVPLLTVSTGQAILWKRGN